MSVDLKASEYISQMNICAYYEVDDQEVREEIFNKLKEIENPESLPYRDIYIDPTDIDEFDVTFSAGSPETPPLSQVDYFRTNIDRDGDYHVHVYSSSELLDDVLELYFDVIDSFDGSVNVRQIGSSATVEKSFSDLGIENTVAIEKLIGKKETTQQNLKGVKLAQGPYDVDIVPHENMTSFSYSYQLSQDISSQEELIDLIESHIDYVDEFLEEVSE